MLWLIFLVVLVPSSAEEKVVDAEEFRRMLHDSAATVIRQHMDEMSRPPKFDMPSDFMRSFVPNSGVGNREELIIGNIKELPVFYDANYTQWQYKRFNNTNYILSTSGYHVALHKLESELDEFFVFSKDDLAFSFTPDHRSVITHATLFTRSVKHSISLYVAILTESAKTSLVNIYEIVGNKGLMVALINLGLSSGQSMAKKISYVQSQYGGSLVVLIDTAKNAEIIYKQEGSSESNHYIELHYPSAVDMITYTIHGHGYIAVTNTTTCNVFKMDQFARSHLLFDSIRISLGNLVGLEYFRLGFHHYLTLAGRNEQHLYVWKTAEYTSLQSFNENNVAQVYSSSLPSCRDDIILFFVGDDSVQIYVYSGKEEVFVKSDVVTPPNFEIMPRSVTSFTRKNKAVLLFLDKNWNLLSFEIETFLESVPNPILVEGEEISKYMESIQDMLKEQTKQVQYVKEVLQNAVRKTGDQTITSFQSFEELRSTEGTTVDSINSTIFVEWQGSNITLDEYKKGTDWLEEKVVELEKLVDDLEKVIPDVVRIDEDVDVVGTKHFVGEVTGSSILALSVNLQTVAGVNLPELQKQVYRLDKPQQITGTVTFEKPLTITGNLDVATTVNGIDISEDVMTTNTKQTSFAEMTFKNKVVVEGDLDISGTLNDLKIRDEIITLSGMHIISGKKIFQNGLIAENVSSQIIDGVDINDMYRTALTKSGPQDIPGTKTFSGGLQTRDINLLGNLNGYDISELAENIVRVDKPATITGHKTFLEDLTLRSSLTVDGRVNDLRIPEDLFLTDVSQEVTGYKEFTGTVFAEDVNVAGKIDGLSIPSDIVTLSGDEEIPSTLFFTDGIQVEKDIIVEGLVDGVDISEVAKEALKLNESSQFENAVFLGPVTITGDLAVEGTVNKINLNEIVGDMVFKDEQNIVVESEKYFKKVVAETVRLDRMMNGFNISVDFMKVHGNQIINGTKTFKSPVTFTTLNVGDGMIGDLNITRFYENRLSLIIEDEVERDIEFSNDVVVEGNLVVHGTVGGLRIPDDIVLRNSTQPISNKVFKNYVTTDNLVVNGDAEISGSFGGVNLTKFYHDRLTLYGDHDIDGDVFIGDSEVSSVELSDGLNGVNIREFASNVMSKTKDQTVTAAKEFTGTTTVLGKITTQKGVNGVDLADLNKRAVSLTEDNLVTGNFEFQNITVNDIIVGGFINGVNLTHLAENSLKNKGLQYVSGTTIFEAGFHVDGDINADAVNDMIIPKDILLKSRPQTITGKFTLGSLGISEDLIVKGYVNGLDLSEIAPLLARIDQETILISNVTFIGPIKVINDIDVSGLVNGIDLSRLSDNVLLKDGYQEIVGNKILRGNVTIKGDVDVGFVNGFNWKEFVADVVRIDTPQTIKSSKVFLGDSEAEEVHSMLTKVDLINGKSLKTLLDDAVFIDVPANITGPKVFKNAIEISGNMTADLINGLQLKTDVITLMCSESGPQVITGQKTFEKLTAYGDIDVAATVNSYNLMDLYQDTLLTENDQVIEGNKILYKEVKFLQNVYADSVNGMKLEYDLVTLNTNQEISGSITFDDVFIEKDLLVRGLINGVNLTQLAAEAIYLDKNQTIDGSYYFNKVLTKSDVAVTQTVNGVNLVAFDRNVSEFWEDASQSLVAIDKHSADNCEMLQYLQDVLSKSYYVLESFVLHQDLKYPSTYFHVKSPLEITLVAMDDYDFATAVPNIWESSSKTFLSPSKTFQTTISKTISFTLGQIEIKIQVGIYEEDSQVLINNNVTSLPVGFKEASFLTRKNQVIIALLFPSKGKCELYSLTHFQSDKIDAEAYGTVTVGKESTSVAIFDMRETLYMAVSRHYAPPYIRGFCKIFGLVNDAWQRIQSISVAASSFVKHFMYHGYHYLAFTNIAPVHETREPKSIQLYRNSGPNELFFTLFQKVPFDDAKGLEIFTFGDLSELYIATWNETTVQVFRLEGESGLKNTFTLHGKCIKDVKALPIDDDIYLAVGQQNLKTDEIVTSMLYKGLTKGSKFTPHNFTYC